jgi:hypothetical protein
MLRRNAPGIREAILAELNTPAPFGGPPSPESVLNAAAKRLGIGHGNADLEQALLTQWNELFRTGLLSWGLNLSNLGAPHFHLTDPGKRTLANLTRDPSNPAGYLRHLGSVAQVNPVALSYLSEALDCYVAGFFKAAAVMTGAAAESIILSLRDATVRKLTALSRTLPKGISHWQVKTVTDSLHQFLSGNKAQFTHPLQEEFDAYWSAFTQQIRATRNEAGHPMSIDPVTSDAVHASLLIFPELAKLANGLDLWVAKDLSHS